MAALDVGTSKIVCLIARTDAEGQAQIVGIGHLLSSGIKAGIISQMEPAQQAIAQAVSAAEQMADVEIDRVVVNISGGHVASQDYTLDLSLAGHEVGQAEVAHLMREAADLSLDESDVAREIIHALPLSYRLDGQRGIKNPLGMIGQKLGVDLHLITAAFGPVRTLAAAVARSHLEVDQMVVSSYASGLSCLVEDETDLGCTMIDMGAGTTTFAIFFEGQCVYTGSVPVGGAHVTNDIARGLTTSTAHAERLKTLYGFAQKSALDERETIQVPQMGDDLPDHATQIPKSHLTGIIQPRLEEVFEMVKKKLDDSGLQEVVGKRVVLTGGASQLPGMRELAQRVLDKTVRLGKPLKLVRSAAHGKNAPEARLLEGTHPDMANGPNFSTAVGLLHAALNPSPITITGFGEERLSTSAFGRLGQWFKQAI